MAVFGAKRITPQKALIVVFLAGVALVGLWTFLAPDRGLVRRDIDESAAQNLTFGELETCTNPQAPPKHLADMQDKLVKIKGYMQPVYGSQRVRRFLLMPVPPQAKRDLSPNQVAVVSLEPGASVKLFRKPVEVIGLFHVGSNQQKGADGKASDKTPSGARAAFFQITAYIVRETKGS